MARKGTRYNAKNEQALLSGINIAITDSSYSGGRRLKVSELFESDKYVVQDAGGISKSFSLSFILVEGLNPFPLQIIAERMRKILDKKEIHWLTHTNYGRLQVYCSTYTCNDRIDEYRFNAKLVIAPPEDSLINLNVVTNIAEKVEAGISKVKEYSNYVIAAVDAGQRIMSEVMTPVLVISETFNNISSVVTTPQVIADRYLSMKDKMLDLKDDTIELYANCIRFDGGRKRGKIDRLKHNDEIKVPVGNIAKTFDKIAGNPSERNDVSCSFEVVIGIVMIETFLDSDIKTIKDMKEGSLFLLKIENRIRGIVDDDVLNEFKKSCTAFRQMISDDAFGLSGQIILKPSDKPLIVALYESKRFSTLDDFYRLREVNNVNDELNGGANDELVVA